MQKIMPFLWFDDQAEEAVNFHVSIFNNSRITGVSWQIVPASLGEMLLDEDTEKTERVMKAMLPMKKLDKGTLEQAYAQEQTPSAV